MPAATLAFVDKVDPAANVRLNLNDVTVWLLTAADFSPPQLRRSVSQTMMRDGAFIAASAYDNRRIVLTLEVVAENDDALATELQKLHRELDRPRNILKWNPGGATHPVYFRTYRSDGKLAIAPGVQAYATVTVTLEAEPFGIGELTVALADTDVTNDPAAAGGCFVDVTGVLGDVPAPAALYLLPSAAPFANDWVIATRRRTTANDITHFLQAESDTTARVDTTAASGDAAMSGGGYRRTTFATNASLVERDAFLWNNSLDMRGMYRVFAIVRGTVANDVMALRYRIRSTTDPTQTVNGDTVQVTVPAAGRRFIVDLGIMQLPMGDDPGETAHTGIAPKAQGPELAIEAQRVSGTGSLDRDYLAMVPADTEMCLLRAAGTSSVTVMLDGPNDKVYGVVGPALAQPTIVNLTPMPRSGALPTLAPGQTTRIFVMREGRSPTPGNDKTHVTKVTVRYHPRYLYVRPAAT